MKNMLKQVWVRGIIAGVVVMTFLALQSALKRPPNTSDFRIRRTLEHGLSPDGTKIALLVGPSRKNSDSTSDHNAEGCYFYILDLRDRALVRASESRHGYLLGLAWRIRGENRELYFKTHKTTMLGNEVADSVGVTQDGKVIYKRKETEESTDLNWRSWSPDGTMLAGTYGFFSGPVCVRVAARDNAEIELPDVCYSKSAPVWINNDSFFVYCILDGLTAKDIQIAKVAINNDTLLLESVAVQHKGDCRLYGCINGKCVYRIENDLFVGSKRVFSGDYHFVYVSGDLVSIEAENNIVVTDELGAIYRKIELTENQHLFGFHRDTSSIYLIEDYREIIRCDLDNPEKRTIIFTVDDIRSLPN